MHKPVSLWCTVLSTLILCASILFITYFTERHESSSLLITYTIGFAAYLTILFTTKSLKDIRWLLAVGVILRCLLLPAVPNLSDDIYRFIWDGRLWNQGINPFTYLPSELINSDLSIQLQGINNELYEALNSPDYFTVYPPVNQFIFALATNIFPTSLLGSTIIIRMFILLAEGLNLWLLYRLLQLVKLPVRNVLIYGLNPLVILELTGNLHFEAVMLCFLLLSLLFLFRSKIVTSAVFFALAICTKLIPLIFLPLYLRRLQFRKTIYFYSVVGLTILLLFLPLLSQELILGMSNSIGLYFQKFEFNASIYYIIREVGYYAKGYNIIESAGKWLAISTLLFILIFTWFERNRELPAAFMWVLLIYLLLSTTVHPWYIIPLLAFSIFTCHRFVVVWSYLIFFSYAGYTTDGYIENLFITALEYGIVLGALAYELSQHNKDYLHQVIVRKDKPKSKFISFIS